MKKVLKYKNIDEALHDAYMFGRNFVIIELEGTEELAKLYKIYSYMRAGIIRSSMKIDGLSCNRVISKRRSKFIPELTRLENGLIAFEHKGFDPKLIKINNGKLVKNLVFGQPGLEIFYHDVKLTLPATNNSGEQLSAYSGYLFDQDGQLVESAELPKDIIEVTSASKNIILESDEDYKLFEQYKSKLTNYQINSQTSSAVNVYMTIDTFNRVGDPTQLSVFPSGILYEVRYLQNYLALEKITTQNQYYYQVAAPKPMYVINGKKEYNGVTHLGLKFNFDITDSIIIFENINLAKSFSTYFSNNQVILNNDRGFRSIIRSLGSLDWAQHIYIPKSDAHFYQKTAQAPKLNYSTFEFEGQTYYHFAGQILNLIDREQPLLISGNQLGGTALTSLPTGNLYSNINHKQNNDQYVRIEHPSDVHQFSEIAEYSICENEIFKTTKANIAYVYDMRIDGNDIVIEVFHHGYRDKRSLNQLEYKGQWQEEATDKFNFYSKNSVKYKENFKAYRFKNTKKVSFKFYYEGEQALIRPAKHLRMGIIRNDLHFRVWHKVATIKPMKKVRRPKYQVQMEKKHTDSYLFMDRGTSAGDNGEHIYRYYLHNDKERTHYYILSRDSKDWDRLSAEGFNLIEYQSDEHKELFLTADKIVTSHLAQRIFNPFAPSRRYDYLVKSKIIFLQHGITIANHRSFLDYYSRPVDLFICGAVEEQQQVAEFSQYPNVQCTGFARFDYLRNERQGYILYAPSWNTIYRDSFVGSEYHKQVQHVLDNPQINQILEANNLRLKLLLHPEFIGFSEYFEPTSNVDIIKPEEVNYNKFISEADMLITDYSSLYFDFLYQEKHVILHQPYELHNATSILEQPDRCVRHTYTIEELVSSLQEIEKLNFISDKHDEILKFFGHIDKDNCLRISNEIEKL